MKIYIDKEITIEEPSKSVVQYCKDVLTLNNPDYDKKKRMGLWTGRTPRQIYLYRVDGRKLILPAGTFEDIREIVEKSGQETEIVWAPHVRTLVNYNAQAGLFDYQAEAVAAMREHSFGILQAPAGCGKTQIGIGLINEMGVKTLWLTHTKDLLQQSYNRAIQCGIDKSLLGKITEGKIEIGEGITFATVQTLAKQDLTIYKDTWDMVIVDECHRCAGSATAVTQFSKVINALAAPYKYGLSATVHRADGLIASTYALLGHIIHEVPQEAVKGRVMQVQIRPCFTGTTMPDGALNPDGTINYTKLITEIAEDKDRNTAIALKITLNGIDLNSREHSQLILSDRLAQLHAIYNLLPEELQDKAAIIDGKMTSKKGKAEREQAIEDMRTGKKRILFASYRLAKEGLDIPRLDRLHLATPQKDYAVIVQSVGRIGRTFPDKAQPVCIDYVDSIGMFIAMYKKRCTIYKKIGCIMRK